MQKRIVSHNSPSWVIKLIKKWKALFNLNDWVFYVHRADEEKLRDKTTDSSLDAYTRVNVPYKTAQFHIGQHLKDDAYGHAIVFHEVRHVVYAIYIEALTDELLKRYVPESDRAFIQKQLDDSLEALIENDVYWAESIGAV